MYNISYFTNKFFCCIPIDIKDSKDTIDIQKICKDKITDLPKDYQNNAAILVVQRVRNLIRYGMNIGKNDKLPALN